MNDKIGNIEDSLRNQECKRLSSQELTIKINEQIQREKALKAIEQKKQAKKAPIWENLLKTKLFNKNRKIDDYPIHQTA